jgi:hypothetical protein
MVIIHEINKMGSDLRDSCLRVVEDVMRFSSQGRITEGCIDTLFAPVLNDKFLFENRSRIEMVRQCCIDIALIE